MKRVISAILFSIITSFAFAAVLYVDNNTSDGTWLGAYEKLEVALNDADYGDDIWVAAGIYYPTESSNRNNTFIISDGISLYGGFKGGETSLSQRDYINNVVVLDGNIGKSDSRTDNVYHVLENNGSLSNETRIDGLTIVNGYADKSNNQNGRASGAGFYMSRMCSPIIENCIFKDNYAGGRHEFASGGAIAFYAKSKPQIINTRFENNEAVWGGAVSGNELSEPLIDKCTFVENKAQFGAAYEGWRDKPVIINSRFIDNTADVYGGAITLHAGKSKIDNCLFYSNEVVSSEEPQNELANYGGAIAYMQDPFSAHNATTGILTNSTFANNSAQNASAVSLYNENQVIDADKLVFWENGSVEEWSSSYELKDMPFTIKGEGDFTYVTQGDIFEINSWSTEQVEVNGVDFTNKYSNDLPERQNGYYHIYYKASKNWAQFEVKGRSFDYIDDPDYLPEADKKQMPFTFEGKGTYAWVFEGDIKSIDSWNTVNVSINGKKIKNRYIEIKDLPERINGKYYIEFKGNKDWSHFEIKGNSYHDDYVEILPEEAQNSKYVLNHAGAYKSAKLTLKNSLIDAGKDKTYKLPENIIIAENDYVSFPESETVFTDTANKVVDNDYDGEADAGWMPLKVEEPDPVLVTDISIFFEAWVDNGDGTYSAFFGYENKSTLDDNPTNVTLTAGGESNYFNRAEYNTYLPDEFIYPNIIDGRPGRTDWYPNSGIIINDWDGDALVWHLNGKTTTATLDPQFDKTPEPELTTDISPIYEGWTNNGDGTYTAYFGYETRSTLDGEPATVILESGTDDNKLNGYDSSVLPDTFDYPNVIDGRPGRTGWWPESPIVISDWDGSNIVWHLNGKTATASLNESLEHKPEIDISIFFEAWVDNGDGNYTAYFGYENNSTLAGESSDVTLTAGSDENYFNNGLYNEYLPNVFTYPNVIEGRPGRTDWYPNSGIVVENWNGQNLVWNLHGKTATASLDPQFDKTPVVDLTPIYDGWTDNGNGSYTAYFGYETKSTMGGEPYTVVLEAGSSNNKLTDFDSSVLPDTFDYPNVIDGRPGRTGWWPESPIVISDWDGSSIVWSLNGKTATASLNESLKHETLPSNVLLVDNNPDDGTWENAYLSLAEALDNATSGNEIWIAAGTYIPTENSDRNSSFEFVSGVKIFGGFLGGETDRSNRNVDANITVLSGDIGVPGDSTDNAYHVLKYKGVLDTNTVLDGVTVSGGMADNPSNSNNSAYGGGMLLENGASPRIVNVTFDGNHTGGSFQWHSGGAVALYGNAEPQFVKCDFINNSSRWGGAISSNDGAYAKYDSCLFMNNSGVYGGAYEGWRDRADFSECEFRNNSSQNYGAGIALHDGEYSIEYCLFEANESPLGAAVAAVKDPYGSGVSNISIKFATFSENTGTTGSALYAAQYGNISADSSMFWGNVNAIGELNSLGTDGSESNSVSHPASLSIINSAFESAYVIPAFASTDNIMDYDTTEDPFINDQDFIIDHNGTGIPEYGWIPNGYQSDDPQEQQAPLLKLKIFLQGGF